MKGKEVIFKQWQQVLNGTKTQTRRIVKPGEFASGSRGGGRREMFGVWKDVHNLGDRSDQQMGFVRCSLVVLESLYRLKWHRAMGYFAAKTYAVQPGHGKKAIGRIRITEIRRERVQDISEADIQAEGIIYPYEFSQLWNDIYKKYGTRWEDNPEVWVLSFELA